MWRKRSATIERRGGSIMPSIVLGSGAYTYEPVEDWGKLPEGWRYVEVAGVDVDSKDNVYLITRGEHPVIVFDREGNFLRSWGEGIFSRRTHAIHIGPDDSVYCTDDGDHGHRGTVLNLEGQMVCQF